MPEFQKVHIEKRILGHESKADKISASETVCNGKYQAISGLRLCIPVSMEFGSNHYCNKLGDSGK